jgi:hypothetical protein
MSFLDASDPAEFVSLLLEYVAVERAAAASDSERIRALTHLMERLEAIQERTLSPADISHFLCALASEIRDNLGDDPVLEHVEECALEVARQ